MPKKSDKSAEDSKEVLDLIDDTKKKPSRRQRQKLEAEAANAPSKVEAAKANALDLFAEDDKPKVTKKHASANKVLGSISKIRDKENEDPALVVGQDIAPIAASEAISTQDDSDADESDDPKLIVIKPPILVPDLAARLGLKPFEVMADLIKLGVFPAPNQPLEPEIAAQVCEIHGFHFEREKRDKDKGFHKEEKIIEEPALPEKEPEDELQTRPPIVTIMVCWRCLMASINHRALSIFCLIKRIASFSFLDARRPARLS